MEKAHLKDTSKVITEGKKKKCTASYFLSPRLLSFSPNMAPSTETETLSFAHWGCGKQIRLLT